jgi:hypothetical protein
MRTEEEKRVERETRHMALPKTKGLPPLKPNRNSPCGCGSGRKFKNCCYLKERPKKPGASEGIFGFAVWLTTLRTPVVFSARHDASKAAMAAGMFCEANGFPEPDQNAIGSLRAPPGDVPLEVSESDRVGASNIDINNPATAYVTGLEDFVAMLMGMVEGALIESVEVSRPFLRKLLDGARAAHANQYDEWRATAESEGIHSQNQPEGSDSTDLTESAQ